MSEHRQHTTKYAKICVCNVQGFSHRLQCRTYLKTSCYGNYLAMNTEFRIKWPRGEMSLPADSQRKMYQHWHMLRAGQRKAGAGVL